MNESRISTEIEDERVARAGLVAAHAALQPLKDDSLSRTEKVVAALRAFRAANQGMSDEAEKISAEVGVSVYPSKDPFHIVASAVFALDEDADGLESVHPYCRGGDQIQILMRAAVAMRGVYAMWDALEDEDDDEPAFGIFLDKEAKRLADGLVPLEGDKK